MVLAESELKVLEVLWENGEMRASDIAEVLKERCQWKASTTYTVLKKCIEKKWITRRNPHYVCTPNLSKENIQHMEIDYVMDRYFDDSPSAFLSAFVKSGKLTEEDIMELQQMVRKLK